MMNNNIQDIYPLTPMQAGMLYHTLEDKKSNAYFEQLSIEVIGMIDIDIFKKSFNKLIEKYDVLRTAIVYKNIKTPQQVVLKERPQNVYYNDISKIDDEKISVYIENFKEKDKLMGFDLTKDCLIRMSILKTTKDKYLVILSSHHIILDGWCMGIILNDLMHNYYLLKKNLEIQTEEKYKYKEYVQWLESNDKEEAREYWKEYLRGYNSLAHLPRLRKQKKKIGYSQQIRSFKINRGMTKELVEIAKRNQVTLNTVMQTVWGILLQRYNNTDTVVFGNVVSGRPPEIQGIEEMVGLFINTIPVRIDNKKDMTFKEMLVNVQKNALFNNRYSYYQLVDIQSLSSLKNNLFDNIMAFENFPFNKADFAEKGEVAVNINNISSFEQTNYDFNIRVVPGEEIEIIFYFNTNIYNPEFIRSVEGHFLSVIRVVCNYENIKVNNINILTDKEKENILYRFNDTKVEFSKNKTIQDLFEEQVNRNPDNISVVYEGNTLTYQELNQKSNQLARVLMGKGIVEDSIIAIMVDSSLEMIIGLMAILKAGGAYLPVDPKYPIERIEYMLEDSRADILLIDRGNIEDITSAELINIKDPELYHGDNTNPVNKTGANDLAYMIYTSGSTGKPKGVMVEHKGVANLQAFFLKEFQVSKEDNILKFANMTFDASVWEIFMALLTGATLFIISNNIISNFIEFEKYLNKNKITLVTLPPNYAVKLNPSSIETLRMIITAGSSATKELVDMWKGRVTYINAYGPTENTVCSTFWRENKSFKNLIIPIGKPISNNKAYVMYKNCLQPVGVKGELCVAGEGLARGYLNRPALTAEKFVENPFSEGRLYKTGDLARWLPDGNIEFLGRIDHQVKIRGYRIEIEEIENQLLKHNNIKDAAVLARGEGNEKYLIAYIVKDKHIGINEIKNYVEKKLPNYMIPAHFFNLEKMLLTSNNKIDRKALSALERDFKNSNEYIPPSNKLEEKIVEIWQKILDVKNIGIKDDFFELGGHSLKVMELISYLNSKGINVKVADIFNYPTVSSLASYIKLYIEENKELIVDIDTAEKLIANELNLKNKIVQYTIDYKSDCKRYYILYIDISNESYINENKIIEFIKNNFDNSIYPHFIKYADIKNIKVVSNIIDKDELSKILELEDGEISLIETKVTNEISNKLNSLYKTIANSPVIGKYPVAPIQKYHLSQPGPSGSMINFESYLDVSVLKKAFQYLIKEQELLRSTLTKRGEELYWEEHQDVKEWEIPYFDFSKYDFAFTSEIIKRLTSIYFFEDYDLLKSLSYRIFLIRENLKEYVLFLPFSHAVFDGISYEIIKNKITKYYKLYEKGLEIKNQKGYKYWDYVNLITEGPVDIKDNQLLELFNIRDIRKYTQIIDDSFNSNKNKSLQSFILKINRGELITPGEEEQIFEHSLLLTGKILSSQLNISKLPIWIINYGRKYKDYTFFNTIGEFIDIIPILVDEDSKDIKKSIQKNLKIVTTKNINFANMIFGANSNFSETVQLLRECLDKISILFSFQGKFDGEELDDLNKYLFSDKEQRDINQGNRIIINVRYTSDIIQFECYFPSRKNRRPDWDKVFTYKINSFLETEGFTTSTIKLL